MVSMGWHSLSVVIGAVNLERVYLEWLNQCSKHLLNIKYLPDHGATWQCRRHKRCRLDPWIGKIPWRRKWQPTPVFLSGQSQGRRRLVGYSPWGHKELAWLSDWASVCVPDTVLGWSLDELRCHQWWGMRWEMWLRQDEPHENDWCPIKESCQMLPRGLSISWDVDIFQGTRSGMNSRWPIWKGLNWNRKMHSTVQSSWAVTQVRGLHTECLTHSCCLCGFGCLSSTQRMAPFWDGSEAWLAQSN